MIRGEPIPWLTMWFIMQAANKFTKIFRQEDVDPPVIFTNVDEARQHFFTQAANRCVDSNTTRVEYQLVKDNNGKFTQMKKTEEFDDSGIGETYNQEKQKLIDSDNWLRNNFSFVESDQHLF